MSDAVYDAAIVSEAVHTLDEAGCIQGNGEKPKIWYAGTMAKQKNAAGKSGRTGFVVGAAGFAKINAVEGIRLKPAMKKRALEADRNGLSAEETRKAIIRNYRKG
jgi:hypothetical protein